jgi:hypothetical protein
MEYREIKFGVKTGSKMIVVLLFTDIIIESRIIKSLLSFLQTKNASGFSEALFVYAFIFRYSISFTIIIA